MGPRCIWLGVCVPLLLPNLSAEYRPAGVRATRRNSTVAPEAAARSHESLQCTHPGADAPSGLVTLHHLLENSGRFLPTNGRHTGQAAPCDANDFLCGTRTQSLRYTR